MKKGILFLSIFFFLFSTSAEALTVKGGTQAQRNAIYNTIISCWLDYHEIDNYFGGLIFELTPYLVGIAGLADSSNILLVSSKLTLAQIKEVAAHEWWHKVWDTLSTAKMYRWMEICGWLPEMKNGWWYDPAENFAEVGRISTFSTNKGGNKPARTNLKVRSTSDFRGWITWALN